MSIRTIVLVSSFAVITGCAVESSQKQSDEALIGKAASALVDTVTLTEDLGSTNGAQADGYYTSSGNPAVVTKWSSTYAVCGGIVSAGDPCSTTSLSAGQVATKIIQQTSNLCRCL